MHLTHERYRGNGMQQGPSAEMRRTTAIVKKGSSLLIDFGRGARERMRPQKIRQQTKKKPLVSVEKSRRRKPKAQAYEGCQKANKQATDDIGNIPPFSPPLHALYPPSLETTTSPSLFAMSLLAHNKLLFLTTFCYTSSKIQL